MDVLLDSGMTMFLLGLYAPFMVIVTFVLTIKWAPSLLWILVLMTIVLLVEYPPHEELMTGKGFCYALYMSQFKGKAPGGAEAADVDFAST
jgi:hypothetical protein